MQNDVLMIKFYLSIICIILNTYATDRNQTTVGNQLNGNNTISHECNYANDVCINLFASTPENSKISNSTDPEIPDPIERIYSRLINAQDIYVLPIVCPVGIIGNSLVAFNLFSKRKTNSSYIYMVFILLADILGLVSDLCLPLSRVLQLIPSKMVYQISVQMYLWNARILSVAFRRYSLNIFCVLSFERLTAIITPFQLYRSITVTRPHFFLVTTFIVSVLPSVFTALIGKFRMVYDAHSDTIKYIYETTDLYNTNEQYFSVILIVLMFLEGPIQIIFFSIINGMIIRGLYENKKSVALASNRDRTQSISKLQTRLFKIFLILSFTNMLAFLPKAISVIVAKLFPETGLTLRSAIMKTAMFGGNFISVLNSLTDFIVFLTVSKDIRRDIGKSICRKHVAVKKRFISSGTEGTLTS